MAGFDYRTEAELFPLSTSEIDSGRVRGLQAVYLRRRSHPFCG